MDHIRDPPHRKRVNTLDIGDGNSGSYDAFRNGIICFRHRTLHMLPPLWVLGCVS